MTAIQINAAALTTFDVDADGAHVHINVRDSAGAPASLVLPAHCVNQLLMTLPKMVQARLRISQGDESLRLVHPLTCFNLEQGERDAKGTMQYILTMETGGGFCASFAASEELLTRIAGAIFGDAPGNEAARTGTARYS